MTQYTVKYDLTEKEEAALRELLPNYQQYIAKAVSYTHLQEIVQSRFSFDPGCKGSDQLVFLRQLPGRRIETPADCNSCSPWFATFPGEFEDGSVAVCSFHCHKKHLLSVYYRKKEMCIRDRYKQRRK